LDSVVYYRSDVEMGTIEVVRSPSGLGDAVRAYRVLIDGDSVGTIRRGASLSVDVPAGRHSVALKLDWTGSPTLTADVSPGARLVFQCGPKIKAGNAVFALLRSIYRRDAWIRLEQAQKFESH
jgi:hypothetical protein